jgi:hypothetical protein
MKKSIVVFLFLIAMVLLPSCYKEVVIGDSFVVLDRVKGVIYYPTERDQVSIKDFPARNFSNPVVKSQTKTVSDNATIPGDNKFSFTVTTKIHENGNVLYKLSMKCGEKDKNLVHERLNKLRNSSSELTVQFMDNEGFLLFTETIPFKGSVGIVDSGNSVQELTKQGRWEESTGIVSEVSYIDVTWSISI